MEDSEFSSTERILLSVIGLIFLVVIGGLIFAPEIFWDDFVKVYIWDPIVKDAGKSGDAGYTAVNTAVYIATMIAAVIAFQALFRKCRFDQEKEPCPFCKNIQIVPKLNHGVG